jgi:hypothetical protein
MTRKLQDALLTASKALPNADANVATDPIDLGSAEPYPTTESFAAELSTTAATGANNKNITAEIQHSDEPNANFAKIAELDTLIVTDANGAGYPAASRVVTLPPATKRYIRAFAEGEANGGNAANGAVSLRLRF